MSPYLALFFLGITTGAGETAYGFLEANGLPNRTDLGYPVPTGEFYEKPTGVCTLSAGKIYGCSCKYGSEPVVLTSNGYAIDAVCAPDRCRSYADCPHGPPGTVTACSDGRCYLTCHKDYQCPWPGRCENAHVIGEVCFFPQWQGMNMGF